MTQNSNQVPSTEEKEEIPLGYRFHPKPYEVIQYFLFNKLMGLLLPSKEIVDLDVYQFDPDQLPFERIKNVSTNEGYFFTPSKIRNAQRRDTPNGYWKVDEEKVPVYDTEKKIIGFKDKLSFYNSNNLETDWKMTEYRCNLDSEYNVEEKYVVCEVRLKKLKETFAGDWWIDQQDYDDSEEDSDESGENGDNDIAGFEQVIRL